MNCSCSIIMIYFYIPKYPTTTIDDLEMDLVAALEAQHLQNIRENCPLTIESNGYAGQTMNGGNSGGDGNSASSPKEARRNEQKKRWKNWSWKYSPGGKTTSIEEEPESPKKTSRHSSPNSSPKHKSKSDTNSATSSNNNLSLSPIRRIKNRNASGGSGSAMTGTAAAIANRVDVRSSAGARLCQLLDDSQDESGDELQALLANGRPASVHIVQMTSGVSLLNNEV